MHQSSFSYNITRAYPFKWFTPSVVIGGIIAAILVSFINFASTGFELVATSSNDPNGTVLDPSHGGIRWPSYLVGDTRATCAPVTLPLNTRLFTQNNAIAYTLESVWRRKDDGTRVDLGSLIYHNNELKRCSVTEVIIDVLGRFTQSPRNTGSPGAGVMVHALANCAVEIDTSTSKAESALGPTYVEIRGTYEAVAFPGVKTFLSRNKTTSLSLYWGESILRTYSALTAKTYMLSALDADEKLAKQRRYNAAIMLQRRANGTDSDTYEETMRNDFFAVRCFVEGNFCGANDIPSLAAPEKNKFTQPYPKIWNRVNLLGKGMWHTVLADLGRDESSVPSMLTHPELLANLTGGLASEVEWYKNTNMPKGMEIYSLLDNQLALKAFDPKDNQQASLGATLAYFSTNYICQDPRPKAACTLFFSILVADLVLLQAVWFIFRFIVDTVAQRKDPSLRHCVGCHQNMELADLGKSSSTAALVAPSSPHDYQPGDD
ncbi:hypothetical protein PG993_005833 [Apiospora rasikravindrae]|uniref:Transmembrane protein n=1 Tax=Apiospora rasikravindrae TaxID=990691 RepID=A0ABR1T9Z3_9PEZI